MTRLSPSSSFEHPRANCPTTATSATSGEREETTDSIQISKAELEELFRITLEFMNYYPTYKEYEPKLRAWKEQNNYDPDVGTLHSLANQDSSSLGGQLPGRQKI
ncbi:hypothetical protein FB45DRAFT_875631 [Roridomyces roridus]|uniref:Uncharacterized protein n=1 Tax=Roridomyces roridus TaxID=1738132 RepID=A0AAD7B4Z4_9AGAR|nr:hypothetical protein FB45DRAFT_875631 [Roridomyces roridus]